MNTYFIRHSSALDIDDDTFNQLWENGLIGVHYPHDANGKLQTKDLSRASSKRVIGPINA